MRGPVTIAEFIRATEGLPSDEPVDDPRVWYRTQKEHWLGWLSEYEGPGAYGRASGKSRDARFAYNHIVEPKMLLWLIGAAGVRSDLVANARQAPDEATMLMQKSGIIRRHVPWETVAPVIWGKDRH